MQIYRPYTDIQKSIECLDKKDLYVSGCLNCPNLILSIFQEKKWIGGNSPDWIYKHPIFKWYWNNGIPYINELLTYFSYAKEKWLKHEGAPNNHCAELNNIFLEHKQECSSKTSLWNSPLARCHKISLLSQNFFWYKRFFRKYITVDIPQFELYDNVVEFNDNKPRKILKNDLKFVKE